MVNKNKGMDIEKLAKIIAADINELGKAASKKGELKDLKNIDFSPILKGATAKMLKETSNRVKARAEEASKKNKTEVAEITGQIEISIKERQARLASGLKELSKITIIKEDAQAEIILNRISADIDLSASRLRELQIEKRVKPGDIGML